MKKFLLFIALIISTAIPSWSMQAVMFSVETAQTNGASIDLYVVVCFSDPAFNNGVASVESTKISNVDPSASISQLQTAIAAGIRAAATAKGFTIPANGVTLLGMSKG